MDRFTVKFSPAFEDLLKEKVSQMLSAGKKEEDLDSRFGKLTVYIDEKPISFFASYEIENHRVYVGGNS